MKDHRITLFLLLFSMTCTSAGRAPRDPSSPTPVADPRLGPATDEGAPPASPDEKGDRPDVPVRSGQAPLIEVRDALEADSLLGRRVRVSGRCTARGEGRRAGSWTLDEAGASIEVRGLVPSSCDPGRGEELTIFAQIEPKAPGSRERLLLRLPD
jgi:hypothetical protein